MSNTPTSQITVRIPLDRPPTEADHQAGFGMEFLDARLIQAGWADAEGTVLKRFKVSFEGHAHNGEFYIEWKAVLRESPSE